MHPIPSRATLDDLLERIFIKTTAEYNHWLYFVLNKKKEMPEEAHLQNIEEYLRPLFNLPLTMALKGMMFQKKELDSALQRKVAEHSKALFEDWKAAPEQVGKADAYKLLYQSRMMCALVDLIEEDTFLPTLRQQQLEEGSIILSTRELFQRGYEERKMFLESRDALIGLRNEAVHYLSLKEGLGRIVELGESFGIPKEYENLLRELANFSPSDEALLKITAQGYKARLHLQQLALQLTSPPGEMESIYPTLRNRLYENLGMEREMAIHLLQGIYPIQEKPENLSARPELMRIIGEAYSSLITFSSSPEEAQRKTFALSRFFIQLPYIFPNPTSKSSPPLKKALGDIFTQLSHDAETNLKRQEPKEQEGPRRVSFVEMYTLPSYRTARMLFQSYQLVSLHLAEQAPSYGNHEVTRRLLTIPLELEK